MLNPNHSTCLHANLHLFKHIARFLSSSFFRSDCNFCLCSSNDPFVTIDISSKYAEVFVQFVRVRSIAYRNSAGISLRP